MTDPYAPAADRRAGEGGLFVPVSWSLAGFALAVTVGFAAVAAGAPREVAPATAMAGGVFGGLVGFGVARIERWSALERPELVDVRGRGSRPVHAAAHLVPAALGTGALVVLGGMLAFLLDNPTPAIACGLLAIGAGWLARKVVAEHRLARALERVESGEPSAGVAELEALAAARWAPSTIRGVARANLGMLALARGDLAAASAWWEGVERGWAGAWARTGRALIGVIEGRMEHGEAELADVLTGPYARHLQHQADAVRLLLVLRRDGDGAARALGEHLLAPGCTPLFVGLLAELRRRGGDEPGARALLDPGTIRELRGLGLCRRVPELAVILAA